MHPIRTYIICCSIMLAAWLAASYSTQLDPSRNSGNGTVGSITVENQGNTAPTSPAREQNEDKTSNPIAHVK
jgi:hypothetical protein